MKKGNSMKRVMVWGFLILVFPLIVVLTGCDIFEKGGEEEQTKDEKEETEEQIKDEDKKEEKEEEIKDEDEDEEQLKRDEDKKEEEQIKDEKEEIKRVIHRNIKAAEEEDMEAYMDTIHEDVPGYDRTRVLMERMFEQYDLEYEVEILEVNIINEEEAEAKVEQVTRSPGNTTFNDNKLTGTHELLKQNGEWKLGELLDKDVEYLD